MNGFVARTARRIAATGVFALVLAGSGAAQAGPVSISPSGNVPAQSTLTVTWTPVLPQGNLAALVLVQAAPNGPLWFNNTLVNSANTGSIQFPLPAGLNCGPSYSYQISELEVVPSAQELTTWGNVLPSNSPSFTIKCPTGHVKLPASAYLAPARKFEGRIGCPTGQKFANGKCLAAREIDKAVPRTKAN